MAMVKTFPLVCGLAGTMLLGSPLLPTRQNGELPHHQRRLDSLSYTSYPDRLKARCRVLNDNLLAGDTETQLRFATNLTTWAVTDPEEAKQLLTHEVARVCGALGGKGEERPR